MTKKKPRLTKKQKASINEELKKIEDEIRNDVEANEHQILKSSGRSGNHGNIKKKIGNRLIQRANLIKPATKGNKNLIDALKSRGKRLIEQGSGINHKFHL